MSNTAATHGGGVVADGIVTVTGGIFQGNDSSSFGGGIAVQGNLTVSRTPFVANHAAAGGGALGATGWLLLDGAVVRDNQTSGKGGGVFLGGSGESRVVNSVFARNYAGLGGSALYLFYPEFYGGGSMQILQTTIASPTVSGPSAIEAMTGTLGISNSIIANYTHRHRLRW